MKVHRKHPCRNCGGTLVYADSRSCVNCVLKRSAAKRKELSGTPAYVDYHRRYWLAKYYSLTPEQMAAMLERQGGVCAICRQVAKRRWVIDHDHNTGENRGVLCDRCNVGLGNFADAEELLEAALEYLRQYKTARAAVA